ncbi:MULTISPECIES: CPBP family intramembrane glutamic endopeptidase [Lactobacillus]|uniref:CPBP family intramembrane metalloprotease n=1 Tax=Lactobacillus xujianguonis TaxID=2495899 RepID=A0A437SWY9_9LACO|nr:MULTISPECIES: type II CAAX endopeptidase family protein [Lactobacillus]RVU71429.1 CPBP family intramembrane metalloprotease [Lactobacillus xujianguonis]RVU72392.1 CPBP family intramembrane metalloprotease [Lactobacillus xujianguonis]
MQNNYELALSDFIEIDNENSRRHNVLTMLLATIILNIAYVFGQRIIRLAHIKEFWLHQLVLIVVLALIAFCAWKFCRTTKLLITRLPQNKVQIIWGIVLVVVCLPFIIGNFGQTITALRLPGQKLIQVFITAVLVAFVEELLFRGLLFNAVILLLAKQKYRFFWTSIITAVLFGLMHLVNLSHQPLQSTLGQVIVAATLGLILAFLRLATNNISWGILLHFWIDFKPILVAKDVGTGTLPLGVVAGVFLPLAIAAIICLYLYNRHYVKVMA